VSTIREQIVAAAVTALNTARPAGLPEFIRTRIDSPNVDQLPANTIYQSQEVVEAMRDPKERRTSRGPVVRRHVLVAIETLQKAGSGQEPDKAADATLAWATKALAAAGSLGGLANDPPDEVDTRFEYEQAETSFCRATTRFRIYYQSRADDAEQAA